MKRNIAKVLTAGLLAGTLLLGGCGKIDPNATVVNIDDGKDTITLGYANFVARYNQATMETMFGAYINDGYWQSSADNAEDETGTKTIEDSTKENVMEDIEEQYLCMKHADEYGISLTDDEKAKISEAAEKFMSSNDQDAIDQIGATKEYVEQMLTYTTYKDKVEQAVKDETKVEVSDEESVQSKISYVFFEFETEDSSDDDEEDIDLDDLEVETEDGEEADIEVVDEVDEETKAKYKASADDVAAASDFEKAAKAAGAEVKTYNYTAAADASEDTVLGEEVITAAKKLKKGQISDPIETDKGYYVVRMDDPKDKETTENKVTSIEGEKKQEAFDAKMEEWKKELKWSIVDSQWKKVKFNSKFTNKESEDTSSEETTTEETEETTTEE